LLQAKINKEATRHSLSPPGEVFEKKKDYKIDDAVRMAAEG
jgi:hypothetical protein